MLRHGAALQFPTPPPPDFHIEGTDPVDSRREVAAKDAELDLLRRQNTHLQLPELLTGLPLIPRRS